MRIFTINNGDIMELEKGEDKKEDKNIPLEVTIQNLDWGHDIFRVNIAIINSKNSHI